MFTRIRYQHGCIAREARKAGPDVWIFRWREVNAEGRKVNRKAVVGTVEQYRTESVAQKAVGALRININQETAQSVVQPLTVEQLVQHYTEKELSADSKKAYSTTAVYKVYLRTWILPRWGTYRIQTVKPVAVEEWLSSLKLANGSKAKIRNLMSALFKHAMRYEWMERNPIALVRQSAKRERAPEVLTEDEVKSLLAELSEPYRTMVFLAATTGLRVSELLALKWSDVNFENLQISLNRAVVHQVVGDLKTEASRKPLPVALEVAEALFNWRLRSGYPRTEDWVFASLEKQGKQPYWPENLLRHRIRPAAERCGIRKRIGWHTFRHSYSTLLRSLGTDIKVQQDLLRHSSARLTLDTYTQSVTPAKRAAQDAVIRLLIANEQSTLAAPA